MKNCLKFRHFLILLLFWVGFSCGRKFPKSSNKTSPNLYSYAKNKVFCKQAKTIHKKLFDEIYYLEVESHKIENAYKSQFPSGFRRSKKNRRRYGLKLPLKLSIGYLSSYLQDNYLMIEQVLSPSSLNTLLAQEKTARKYTFNRGINYSDLVRVVSELRNLAILAARFQNYQCSLNKLAENKSKDVRIYFDIKEKFCGDFQREHCLEHQLKYFENLDSNTKETLREYFLELCIPFSNEANCTGQFMSTLQRKGNLLQQFQDYFNAFEEEKVDSLFKISKSSPKFDCDIKNDVYVLKVSIYTDIKKFEKRFGRNGIKRIEKIWSNKFIKLKISLIDLLASDINAPKNSFKLLFKNKVQSHVILGNKRVIILDSNLDNSNLEMVLSHEIGHVLGFKDCYVEFFDNHSREIVYYEIEKFGDNLMCSVSKGQSVPDDYFNQLLIKNCY